MKTTQEVNVKRFAIATSMLLVLMLCTPALAVDLTGMIGVGGYGSYGFGFGNAFENSTLEFGLGGCVSYHINANMGVVGFVDYQTQKSDDGDDTSSWMAISGSFAYFLASEGNTVPYLIGGPGIYVPSEEGSDTEFGFNFGGGVLHFFQPEIAVNGGARFHYIAVSGDEDALTYVEFFVGASFFFGGTK